MDEIPKDHIYCGCPECGECDCKWCKSHSNYSLKEMIQRAMESEYGAVWYSEKGPIQITKEGKLEPIL